MTARRLLRTHAGGHLWGVTCLHTHLQFLDREKTMPPSPHPTLQRFTGGRFLQSLWCLAMHATAALRQEAGLPEFVPQDPNADEKLFRVGSVRRPSAFMCLKDVGLLFLQTEPRFVTRAASRTLPACGFIFCAMVHRHMDPESHAL
jgi:hypothetical protein